MLEVGQSIDRFTIERVLGQGGMAIVYLVTHHKLQSQHALKVLTVGSKAITERMMQEGRVQASLRHPNIVAVHDVLDIADQPALLMEYIDGPALDEYFLDQGRPDAATALRIFDGTCQAVFKAHQGGLIHRDLKPGNILLQRSGRNWIPKVTDFGLAKLMQGDTNLSKTRSGVAMGTPSYMSPEQIRDAKNVDHRSDIFALGAILYELYTGEQAFGGENILEIFNKVSDGAYVDPLTLNPSIPPSVIAAIHGALQIDADARIPDAQTLLDVALGNTEFGVEERVRANPTILPDFGSDASHGETLAPDDAFIERGDATVLRPGAGTDTIVDPRQANATVVVGAHEKRLSDLGISYTTMDPGGTPSGASLPLVVAGMLLTFAAMSIGAYFGIQALVPQPATQPTVVAIAPAPTPVQIAVEPVKPVVKPPKPAPASVKHPVAVAPPPKPVVVKVPTAKPAGIPTTWNGILGQKTLQLQVTSQRGERFEASVSIAGHPMHVQGTANKSSVRFTEVGGGGVFSGKVRTDGRWLGGFKRQTGAAEEQWFLQPR